MLVRKTSSLSARSAFFEKYNDIDVYVEDASRETRKLFAKILGKAFGADVALECVFPLGSRREVIAACQMDQGDGGRRRVYIVDSDIDLCCRRVAPVLKRFYRLPRYCLENFLIEEGAASHVAAWESENLDERQAAEEIRFHEWVRSNATPLRRLFLSYAAVALVHPRIKTVGIGYGRLLSDDSGVVDPLKVEGVIAELRDEVDLVLGKGAFDVEFVRVENDHKMKSDVDFMLHFVSGKDYLLPLLRLRMNKVVRIQKPLGVLKINLAEFADPAELHDLLDVAC